jgi:hypothetical protein
MDNFEPTYDFFTVLSTQLPPKPELQSHEVKSSKYAEMTYKPKNTLVIKSTTSQDQALSRQNDSDSELEVDQPAADPNIELREEMQSGRF